MIRKYFSIKFSIQIFTLITLQLTFRLITNLREIDDNLKVSFFFVLLMRVKCTTLNETRSLSERNLTVRRVYYFFHFDIYGSTRYQKTRLQYDKVLFITSVFDEDESRCLIQYKKPLKIVFLIILQETIDYQY